MVWIPVILTLVMGPGMGQLYNKEYKKGAYLIILSLIVFLAAGYYMKNMLIPYLPTDITTEDPLELTRMMQENAHKAVGEHTGALFGYMVLLMGIWGYSVVDAYKGGRRRAAEKLKTLTAK